MATKNNLPEIHNSYKKDFDKQVWQRLEDKNIVIVGIVGVEIYGPYAYKVNDNGKIRIRDYFGIIKLSNGVLE